MKIRIITDSASDMPNARNDMLTVLPMTIGFGAEEYLDGVTLSHDMFYEKLQNSGELPVTSQITPFRFEETIKESIRLDETVIIITMSSKLSGTYASAVTAAKRYSQNVFVIDSENVCVGERILVEYAISLVNCGMPAEKIVQRVEDKKKNVRVVTVLDTLEYLYRGGRVSKAVRVVGSLLSIKPIAAVVDGNVIVIGKARGNKNGNNFMTRYVKEQGGINFDMPFLLGYTGVTDDLLKAYMRDNAELLRLKEHSVQISSVGGTIGTHVGPGAIAVAFFINE